MINKPLSNEIVKQRYLFIKDSLEKKHVNAYYSENEKKYHLVEMLIEVGEVKTANHIQHQLDKETNQPISELSEKRFEEAVRKKALEKLSVNSNYKFSAIEAKCVKKKPLSLLNKTTSGKTKTLTAVSL